jgi:hypothetical protein
MINIELEPEEPTTKPENTDEPDENSGIVFQGFLKIFDPETGEVYTQGRA